MEEELDRHPCQEEVAQNLRRPCQEEEEQIHRRPCQEEEEVRCLLHYEEVEEAEN